MILALWFGIAHAAPAVVWPVDAVPLKSGGWVQVDPPGDGVVPRVAFLAPAGPDRVTGVSCAVSEPASWEVWSRFFEAIQAEKLPVAQVEAAAGEAGGCVAEAAWGATDATRNVVTLKVQVTGPRAAGISPFVTTLSRREAELVVARLAPARAEAVRRSLVIVEVPPPASAVVLPAPAAGGADAAEEAARILYRLRGWRPEGDPGFEADVAAIRALSEAGVRPSDVVARALDERRLRPGVLGDMAQPWGFSTP